MSQLRLDLAEELAQVLKRRDEILHQLAHVNIYAHVPKGKRVCPRCEILYKPGLRRHKRCKWCRKELAGESATPMIPKQKLEPEAGLGMLNNERMRFMARRISHDTTQNIIENWTPVNPHITKYDYGRNP